MRRGGRRPQRGDPSAATRRAGVLSESWWAQTLRAALLAPGLEYSLPSTVHRDVPTSGVSVEMIIALMLGVALAAACGLRAFLPLAMLSALSAADVLSLGDAFTWLGSPPALACFSAAVIVEILGDKVPGVDHALDLAGTAIRPAAGSVAAVALVDGLDPLALCVLGLVTGGAVAGGVHLVKAGARAGSTATTGGLGNPMLSLLEDLTALGVGAAAVTAMVMMS